MTEDEGTSGEKFEFTAEGEKPRWMQGVLGKSELQNHFRVRCAARCWSINTGHKAPIARLYYQ